MRIRKSLESIILEIIAEKIEIEWIEHKLESKCINLK